MLSVKNNIVSIQNILKMKKVFFSSFTFLRLVVFVYIAIVFRTVERIHLHRNRK